MRSLRVLVAAPLLISLACDRGVAGDSPAAPPPPTTPKAPESKTTGTTSAAAPAAADKPAEPAAAVDAKPEATAIDTTQAAIFFVRDKGVVVLGDDGFHTLADTGSSYFSEVIRGADGKIYAANWSGIVTLDGGALTQVATIDSGVQHLDVARDGTIWTAGTKGVGHRDGGTWTFEPDGTFGSGNVLYYGLALDGEGHPWVVTADAVFHHDGSAWKTVAGPKYLQSSARAPDGRVFVIGMNAVMASAAGGTLVKFKAPKSAYASFGDMAFSSGGVGVLKNDLEGVAVVVPGDAAARYRAPTDFKVGMISAIAVDDQRRVWVAGDGGIAIVGPDKQRVMWRSGTMDEIAGQVNHIVLMGAGPELPEAGEVHRGTITGRVVKGQTGVAALSIELCESPSMIYSRTPCTGAPTHLVGKTDADGRFTFADVPLGAYGVAVKVGRKWQITLGTAMGSMMKQGESFDVGEIALAEK